MKSLTVMAGPGGNYQEKIEELKEKVLKHFGPGKVVHADVRHDDNCPLLVHGRPCNCNVEISFTAE